MDELSLEQVEKLRDILLRRREELENVLALSQAGSTPVDLDEPIGRISRMDAIAQQKMIQAGRHSQEAEIRRVALALADMDTGDYGYCRECEEVIAFERLQVRPEARICVPCQRRREAR